MTVSILQTLATLPGGSLAPRLSLEELSAYLKSTYGSKAEADRMRRHCLRDEFYCDGGVDYMEGVIDCVVTDQKVRDLRKPWVKHTRFNNALKRIINELSTVYTQPAKRSVDGDDANQQAYRELLAAVRWDELALQMSRLLNLHRQLLIGFRVTQMPDGTRAPTVDIATPASVVAVTHPNDSKMVIGWIIKTDHKKVRPLVDVPTYVLWTDHERIYLDGEFKVMADRFSQQYMYLEHGLGVCPWMPVSLAPPRPGFWSGEEGEDLVSAHVCIWLANIFMMKETKSASKVPVFSGDTSTMAREQAIDSEGALDVPEGVGVSVIDMSMDLSMFRDGADHILASAGNNYGMPPNLIKNEGVQSAEARDLMRVPLRELRLQQQSPLRIFEGAFARMQSAVLAKELPSMSFDATGWRIDFGESQTPLSRIDSLNLFEAMRKAGLDNSVAYLMRENPDLTEDQAWQIILDNIRVELKRNIAMRPLQAVNGALGQPQEEAVTPQGNGANGQAAAVKEAMASA